MKQVQRAVTRTNVSINVSCLKLITMAAIYVLARRSMLSQFEKNLLQEDLRNHTLH
jgi:hypothetical protein